MRRSARQDGSRLTFAHSLMLNQELVLSFQRAMILKMELDRAIAASMSRLTAQEGVSEGFKLDDASSNEVANTTDVTTNPFETQSYKAIEYATENADFQDNRDFVPAKFSSFYPALPSTRSASFNLPQRQTSNA